MSHPGESAKCGLYLLFFPGSSYVECTYGWRFVIKICLELFKLSLSAPNGTKDNFFSAFESSTQSFFLSSIILWNDFNIRRRREEKKRREIRKEFFGMSKAKYQFVI